MLVLRMELAKHLKPLMDFVSLIAPSEVDDFSIPRDAPIPTWPGLPQFFWAKISELEPVSAK